MFWKGISILWFTGTTTLLIPSFFFRKKGYINFVPKPVRCQSLTFLVNVSLPKLLDIAASNFAAE